MIIETPTKYLEKVYRIIPVKSVVESFEDAFNTIKKDDLIRRIPCGVSVLAF
ncbi:MAG: hypothetical protein WED07_09585 [Candidatus Freyarchaeum deiterrae]